MKFSPHVDQGLGVQGSLGVHIPVEDVNLKIRVRTSYDPVQR